MRKTHWIILPALIFLTSCFASRKTQSDPHIVVADPVTTSLDTAYRIIKATPLPDSARESELKLVQAADSGFADTLSLDPVITDSVEQEAVLLPVLLDTITIIGTGDIMPGTNFPDNRYLPPGNNCAKLFAPVRSYLQDADICFGNLEGVFCSEGGKAKNCRDPKTCYVFRMPDEYLDCILDAGYDVLSVANNHVNDFGYEGRLSTMKMLEDAGVPFAGFSNKPYDIFERDGIVYGFAAFAPHSGTANMKDYDEAARIVSQLDSTCDVIIVSFHGGAEGKDYQHVPCTDEEYLGYNRGNVCKFAHAVVDAGADVVFGHGPHVIRGMELYQDKLICYSLGNFCTYARFNLSGPNGLAPIVKVFTNRNGDFLGGEIIPVYQTGEGGPHLDDAGRAILKLQDLSKSDFPNSPLKIDDNGILSVQ